MNKSASALMALIGAVALYHILRLFFWRNSTRSFNDTSRSRWLIAIALVVVGGALFLSAVKN